MVNGQLKGKQSVIDSGANLALGWTFGAASAACWGLGYIARRLGLESMASPIVGVIIGALLTSVILITMNYKSRGLPLRLSYFGPPTSRMPMLLAGLFSTGGQIAAFTALHLMENTAIAVILISLDSLFMLLFSRFVIGKSEVITPLSFVYMLIALSGCALAILH